MVHRMGCEKTIGCMDNAKVRQTDEAGLMGGIQSMPSKKEGINQGWPIKESADHKKSLRTIKRVC